MIIILGSITITTVLADTVTITSYPYQIPGQSSTGLIVTSSGTVGIGTTSPYSTFEVNPTSNSWGEGVVVDPSATGYNAIFFRQPGHTGSDYTNTWFVGKENTGKFAIIKQGLTSMSGVSRVDAPLEISDITGNAIFGGSVGIGTTSPQQTLDVTGNIRLTGNIVSPNDICIGSC
ncbi:MAG: hypothetical protein KGI08_09635 [Thaumarchaeota archaeon]|nr:hypothetical protein [Nitrososphaerota archaeon]